MVSKLQDGDKIQHVAKIGSDFATGHGKILQKKGEDFDEDGSHNSAFQTLQLSIRGIEIFRNATTGGSELLRITSIFMEKDTKEKMAANMKILTLLWDLLKAINSSHLQDIAMFKAKAQRLFNLWIQLFTQTMTANVHLLLSHGAEYLR